MCIEWRKKRFQIISWFQCEIDTKIVTFDHTFRESSQRIWGIIRDGKDALLVAALFEANEWYEVKMWSIVCLGFEVSEILQKLRAILMNTMRTGESYVNKFCLQTVPIAPFKS